MRSDRLLAITLLLLNRGGMTAGELAARFEVSTRTVYRDIDMLAQAGVPVYAARGTGGGIRLMEGFTLERGLFTPQEQSDLLLAVQTLQVSRQPGAQALLEKMATVMNAKPVDWLKIDVTAWGEGPETEHQFIFIREAILMRQRIEFDYIDGEGRRSHRSVDPLSLLYKGNSWYVDAWCNTRNAVRMFRLSRIRNLLNTRVVFEPHQLPPQLPEEQGTAPVKLVLRFHPHAEHRLLDVFPVEHIHKDAEGYFWVHPMYPPGEWVFGFLLSFGPDVEVVAPEDIRTELCERLKRATAQYQSPLFVTMMKENESRSV